MTDNFNYETSVSWKQDKIGKLASTGMPDLEVATPPEFKGHPEIWTPEHLFVASAEICLMTTFLAIAEKARLKFLSYRSCAKGTLAQDENKKYLFTKIEIYPEITVDEEELKTKALSVIQKAENHCLISHSIKTNVVVYPRATVST